MAEGQTAGTIVQCIGPVIDARSSFSTGEWIDLLIRSLGMEPSHPYFTRRRKLLYLARLIILDPANPILLVPVLVTGFLVNPAWHIWVGLTLRQR